MGTVASVAVAPAPLRRVRGVDSDTDEPAFEGAAALEVLRKLRRAGGDSVGELWVALAESSFFFPLGI